MDLQVDALYFQAREGGVSYAIVNERVVQPDFNSRWGARGQVAIDLGCDCWALGAEFLHYHARTNDFFGFWRLHMGIGDVFLGYDWKTSGCLELKPYFGLSYAMIRTKLEYDSVRQNNKFWGVGPLFGLESFWELWGGFGIIGRGAMRLFFGHNYVHQGKLLNEYEREQPAMEGALGLQWSRGSFFVRSAFEVYFFDNINQFEWPNNRGSLSLSGLSLGAGLSF